MRAFVYITALFLTFVTITNSASAQMLLTDQKWQSVANDMPNEWYGTEESKKIAENVLLYQRTIGGWPKNIPFHKELSESDKARILNEKETQDAIFDNGATTTEIRFLAKMYVKTGTRIYKDAIEKGLWFVLKAQYKNGGWPMFFPLRKGYYTHITFNDDATYRIMKLLENVYKQKAPFTFINDKELLNASKESWDRGLKCILQTQIMVNGKPTIWCAQHDELTLMPAKARAYELPSFSGYESVGLLDLLMDIENPSPEVIRAIQGGIEWFESHKLIDKVWESFINEEGKSDHRLTSKPGAEIIWARFYDLETGLPFYCGRDGVKKGDPAEIEYERRNGYSWFTNKPQKVLDQFTGWKAKWL